ncbi:DUF4226 domain-containing protein [Mycobacterium heckeshornense]|uniref:DUF4226 domain-containing protein n=1 Tax=Mycobacterium heckeshornense TaxID=110505 RepID=UPI000671D4CA|nr:DUF4226 domain-containing protein [Mycobacterium heckeshornense]KMV22052.1 hypothetical protein ACT16_13050 [Mycobacterium heckeshornense]
MTGWASVVVGDLVGGISQVLGSPPPLSPTTDADPRQHLDPQQRAVLTYMGINPDTAPIDQINKALTGAGQPALPTNGSTPPVSDSPQSVPPAPAPGSSDPTTPGAAPGGGGLSGAAADAAKRLGAALEKNRNALNEADQKLAEAILNAKTSSEEGKARLGDLQQSIIDQVQKLGPSLDTPAGQQQLADFLQGKTSQIMDVLKSAGLDSASQSAVLDGLTARYDALGDKTSEHGAEDQTGKGGSGQTGSSPTDPAGTTPGAGGAGGPTGGAGALPDDPMLGGLASDPLLGGLASMLGPGIGGLGALPGMLGGMSPFGGGMGGGGLPIGDLGSGIGSAIRDASHTSDPVSDDTHEAHKATDAALKDLAVDEHPETKPAGTQGATPAQEANAGGGQVNPSAQQPPGAPGPPDTTVKLPSGGTVTAENPAVAKAGRAVLDGASVDDAYRQAGITLSPPGSPVTAPVSPSRLMFGDIGQYTDHRVMALGDNKVWVNGKETPLEELETGPNFLGWEHPSIPSTTPQPVVATSAATPAPEIK